GSSAAGVGSLQTRLWVPTSTQEGAPAPQSMSDAHRPVQIEFQRPIETQRSWQRPPSDVIDMKQPAAPPRQEAPRSLGVMCSTEASMGGGWSSPHAARTNMLRARARIARILHPD